MRLRHLSPASSLYPFSQGSSKCLEDKTDGTQSEIHRIRCGSLGWQLSCRLVGFAFDRCLACKLPATSLFLVCNRPSLAQVCKRPAAQLAHLLLSQASSLQPPPLMQMQCSHRSSLSALAWQLSSHSMGKAERPATSEAGVSIPQAGRRPFQA